MDWGLVDVVLLHLVTAHDRHDDAETTSTGATGPAEATTPTEGNPPADDTASGGGTAPAEATVAGLSEALAFEHGAMSNAVQLLSAIRTLKTDGFVEETTTTAAGDDARSAYVPTADGRERAARFERALADETVTVDDGTTERTVRASDVGMVVDDFTREACLLRLVHGSVLYVADGRQHLVGRDDEFDAILAAYENPAVAVTIVRGPAGIGKSALVEAVTDAIRGDTTVLCGDCDPTVTQPYGPIRNALAAARPDTRPATPTDGPSSADETTTAESTTGAESTLTADDTDAADHTDTVDDTDAADHTDAVDDTDAVDGEDDTYWGRAPARLLEPVPAATQHESSGQGDESSDEDSSGGSSKRPDDAGVEAHHVEDPDVAAARATEYRERIVNALADSVTDDLVLVLEDAQWIDAATVAFLEDLESSDVAATIVVTYRPAALGERHVLHALAPSADATIDLGPLDRAATATLASNVLGVDAIPGSFVDRVHDHTDGNPLFVTETLASQTPASVIDGNPDATDWELPAAVEEAVRESLDALDDTALAVLEYSAVAGRSVPLAVLERVVDVQPTVVEEYVDLFADGRYLDRDDDTVVFADERTRQVLTNDIDAARRRDMHAALADAFDTIASDGDVSSARVAYHYRHAGDHATAYEHYVAAGDEAMAVYAHATAIDRYEAAMESARELDDDDPLLTALEEKGKAHLAQGEYADAEQSFEYVQDRASSVARRRMAAYHRARIVDDRDSYQDSLEIVDDALAIGEDETAPAARLLGQRGWTLMNLGEYDASIESFEQMLSVANALDDDRLRAQAHDHMGVTLFLVEELDRATEHCERAVELVSQFEDAFTLGRYLNNLAITITDRERSAATYERALKKHREAGDVVTEIDTLTNLGFLESKEDPAASLSYFLEAAERADRLGYTKGVGAGSFNAGIVQIPLGDLDAAREHLETSRAVHEQLGRVHFLHGDFDGLARIALLRDDLDAAADHATRGLDIANDVGRAMDRVDSLITTGDVERARNGPQAGREAHERALDLAREDDDVRSRLFAHLALADDHLAVDDPVRARRHAHAAAALAAAESDRRRIASAAYRLGVANRSLGDERTATVELTRAIDIARDGDLDLVECAARFERARIPRRDQDDRDGGHVESGTPEPASELLDVPAATDRERALALVAETGASRLERVADDGDDTVAPTSV